MYAPILVVTVFEPESCPKKRVSKIENVFHFFWVFLGEGGHLLFDLGGGHGSGSGTLAVGDSPIFSPSSHPVFCTVLLKKSLQVGGEIWAMRPHPEEFSVPVGQQASWHRDPFAILRLQPQSQLYSFTVRNADTRTG